MSASLYCVGVYKKLQDQKGDVEVTRLGDIVDASSFKFWERGTVPKAIRAVSRIVIERIKPGHRGQYYIEESKFVLHLFMKPNGMAAVVITER
jgi:hypothetical protein